MGNAETKAISPDFSQSLTERLNIIDFLKRTREYRHMPESQLEQVAKALRGINYFNGEAIFLQNMPAQAVFFISLGEVDLVYRDSNEDEVVIRTCVAGEILGTVEMLQKISYRCTARAIGEVSVFELTLETYEKMSSKAFAKPIVERFESILSFTKVEYMRRLEFLQNLPTESLCLVSQILRIEILPAGTVLVTEGEKGDRCYFIFKGQVAATVKNRHLGNEVELTTIEPGKCIGERHFMSNKPQVASIVTLEETHAFSLSKTEFDSFLDRLPQIKKQLQRQQRIFSHVDSILSEVDIFKTLSNKKRQLLAYCVKPLLFKPGEEILREGYRKKYEMIYIIVEGTCDVFLRDKTFQSPSETKLGRGGKSNSDEQIPSRLLLNKKVDLSSANSKENSSMSLSMKSRSTQRMSKNIRDTRKFKKMRTIGRGNFFGEVALIADKASSATVKASKNTRVKCLCIEKQAFLNLFMDEKSVLAEICIRVLGPNAPLLHILNHPVFRKAFEEHCENTLSVENINFFIAVTELEAIQTSYESVKSCIHLNKALKIDMEEVGRKRDDLVKASCLEIFHQFASEESPQQININSQMRENIVDRINSNKFGVDLYAEAKAAIFTLMDTDIMNRFKNSVAFKTVLASIQPYDYSATIARTRITKSTKFSMIVQNNTASSDLNE